MRITRREKRDARAAEWARSRPYQCAHEVADYGDRGVVLVVLGCRHETRAEAEEHAERMRVRELEHGTIIGQAPRFTSRELAEYRAELGEIIGGS